MNKTTMKLGSYITLINRFWRLHKTHQFSTAATSLYFYLLDVANAGRWPQYFAHPDALAAVSISISLPTLKSARKQLIEAGLISMTPGGKGYGKKTVYSLIGCENCEHVNSAECMPKCIKEDKKETNNLSPKNTLGESIDDSLGCDLGERISEKTCTTIYKDKIKTKNTPPQSEKEDEIFDLENLKAPQDGINRNLDAMVRNLRSIHVNPIEAKQILVATNYGQIGHPIWGAFAELKNANGAIKSPKRFIFSKIFNHQPLNV